MALAYQNTGQPLFKIFDRRAALDHTFVYKIRAGSRVSEILVLVSHGWAWSQSGFDSLYESLV